MKVTCQPISARFGDHGHWPVVLVQDGFVAALNEVEIPLVRDYYSAFRCRRRNSRAVRAGDYLAAESRIFDDRKVLCPELPIPKRLAGMVRLSGTGRVFSGPKVVSMLHVARSGCIAPLHFDWDYSWVAHACVSGRKRFFLFPPSSGWLLSPVVNTSAYCVPLFSEKDRSEFLRVAGGVELELRAGEGVLFPSLFWHAVLYDEASISVSVRFEAEAGGRPFAALPRSWLLQRVAACFLERGYGHDAEEFLLRLLSTFFAEHGDWKSRYRRVMEVCRQELSRRGEEGGVVPHVGENFSAEMAMAARELRVLYDGFFPTDDVVPVGGGSSLASYLFEGTPYVRALGDLGLRLANYALRMRQGLPPRRGLVDILKESER